MIRPYRSLFSVASRSANGTHQPAVCTSINASCSCSNCVSAAAVRSASEPSTRPGNERLISESSRGTSRVLAPAARGFTQGITVTAPATESRRSASSKYQIAPIAVGSSPCRAPVISNRVSTLPFPDYRRPVRDRSVPVPFRPSLMSTRLVRSFGGMGKKRAQDLKSRASNIARKGLEPSTPTAGCRCRRASVRRGAYTFAQLETADRFPVRRFSPNSGLGERRGTTGGITRYDCLE